MASPRTTLRPLVVATLAVAGVLSVLPGSSSADQKPTLAQVEARVNALDDKVGIAVEEYAQAKIALAAASRRSAVAQARVRAAQAQLDAVRRQMSAVAAAAYRSGGMDQFVQLVSNSTPQTFLDRSASLDRIAATQRAELEAAATARHRLASAQAEAAQDQSAQAAVATAMGQQQAAIQSALAEQQRLLSSLKADQLRQLRAAQAQADRAAAAARASRSRSLADSTPSYNGPASGRAGVAVQAAYAELGKPYQWGASGPSSFDCSGLTMWAWGKAGVSLPHSAAAQYDSGQHVSAADLQPGDLVFYGSPIHHVGIYIGNGNMIEAAHSGTNVRISSYQRPDFVGAARP